jgi:hypothetical protein
MEIRADKRWLEKRRRELLNVAMPPSWETEARFWAESERQLELNRARRVRKERVFPEIGDCLGDGFI